MRLDIRSRYMITNQFSCLSVYHTIHVYILMHATLVPHFSPRRAIYTEFMASIDGVSISEPGRNSSFGV